MPIPWERLDFERRRDLADSEHAVQSSSEIELMSQDSFHKRADENWTQIAEMVETAARARRLFPVGGFRDLNVPELQVLLAITVWPDLSVGELAEALALEKSSVSSPLAKLAEKGLVSSKTDGSDGRSRRQKVTKDGRKLAVEFIHSLDSHAQ